MFKIYLKLFKSAFFLSAFTFGGGYVIVALMRQKFVDEFKWLTEDEMLDITAIAQTSPGVIAVNASILVGYKIAGIWGAIVSIIGTVLPPLLVITLISYFYDLFIQNKVIASALLFMRAGAAAVILDVSVSLTLDIAKKKSAISIILMITAFTLIYFLKVNIIYIILAAGLIGFFYGRVKNAAS